MVVGIYKYIERLRDVIVRWGDRMMAWLLIVDVYLDDGKYIQFYR